MTEQAFDPADPAAWLARGGLPATGFTMPCGRSLVPERIVLNRNHLRAEMTILLRDFAAALRNL